MPVSDYDPIFEAAGREWNVDPTLLRAMAHQESGGNPRITSRAGAQGVMQLMPETQKAMGVADPNDPVQSIYGGAKYMAQLLDKYGTPARALAAYNAGPDRVDGAIAGKSGLPDETVNYVPAVASHYSRFAAAKKNQAPAQAAAAPDVGSMSDDQFLAHTTGAAPSTPTAPTPKAPDVESDEDFLARTAGGAVAPTPPTTPAPSNGNAPSNILDGTPDSATPAQQPTAFQDVVQKIGAGLGSAAHSLTDAPAEALARGADALGLTAGQGQQTAAADQAANQAYQQQYGNSGIASLARLGGQIAGTAPLLAAGGGLLSAAGGVGAELAGGAATSLGRGIQVGTNFLSGSAAAPSAGTLGNLAVRGGSLAAEGALGGAGAAALTGESPVSGAETGAVLGPALGAAGSVARGLWGSGGGISPEVAQLAQLARDKYKIPITAPQMSGNSLIRIAADQSSKLPFSGAGASAEAQQSAFNRAVANTFGESADKITPNVMSSAAQRIGIVFDDVAKRTSIKADPRMVNDLRSVMADAAQTLPASERVPVNNQVTNVLQAALDGNGVIDGKTYQALTRTNAPLSRAEQSSDPNVSYYASQVRNALDDAFQRSAAPEDQAALGQAKQQYRAMKTVQDLAASSTDGDVSPAALMAKVKSASNRFDGSTSGMAYTGGGPLGDLAHIGQAFMKHQPDSGTAARLMVNGALMGGAAVPGYMLNPLAAGAVPVGLAANALANSYLRSGWVANRLINSSLNPNNVGPTAALAGAVGPYLTPTTVMGVNNLLRSNQQ